MVSMGILLACKPSRSVLTAGCTLLEHLVLFSFSLSKLLGMTAVTLSVVCPLSLVFPLYKKEKKSRSQDYPQ